MSSNSLELLLNIGMLDFRSPCLAWLDLKSGEINLANILGGFIKEILGVLCSWLFVVSSCSSVFVLLLVAAVERSPFFAFMASGDGTSSSGLPSNFSVCFEFVRSLMSIRGVDFSVETPSFLVTTSLHGSSFV